MSDFSKAAGVAAVSLAACAGIAGYLALRPAPEGPQDGRAWVLEARAHMAADRYQAAARSYENGLAASRKVAADPLVWCELADALGMAQGGSLQGRPLELIEKALALNPNNARALEMAGSAAYEVNDYATALRYWERLLPQLPPGSSAFAELSSAIARTRSRISSRS